MALILPAIQQLAAERPILLGLPRLRVPAELILGLLDQRKVRVRLDRLNRALDEMAAILRPVRRDLRDRRRAVPLEPLRLYLVPGNPAGQDDLESPLAKPNAWDMPQW